MKQVLLDTTAYSHFLAGEKEVLDILGNAEITYMSIFVIGELLYGFKGGRKEKQNRKILDEFLLKSTVKILSATMDTAEHFGAIKSDLRANGTPLPVNDIWIASHAMETGSTLLTYDKHFEKISGLLMVNLFDT